MWTEVAWRQLLRGIEATFTAGWSVGEVAYAMRHPKRLREDPFRKAVLEDIDQHGLYKRFAGEAQVLVPDRRGWMSMSNPYVRVGGGETDKVVAQLRRVKRPRRRHVVVVCHCYGLPLPALMEQLFGLHLIDEVDVVYNIMNHHYLGSFRFWPGFGLFSPQMSRVVENVRSSVTGLRALLRSLVHTFGYEEVTLVGYSIGGHLSLHVANHHPIDRLVAYCPVTSLEQTATELGLMPWMSSGVARTLERMQGEFDFGDLDVLNPLNQDIGLSIEDLLLILQTHDAMVPTRQSMPILERYPSVRCLEYPGTHAFPVERRAMQRAVREFVLSGKG